MTSTAKIKVLLYVFVPTYLLSPWVIQILLYLSNNYFPAFFEPKPHSNDYPPHLMICQKANHSMNYLGSALVVSNSNNETDLVLCPGDTFGDLNDTYITVESCSFEMHSKDGMIWSLPFSGRRSRENEKICAVSLQKDGNLVFYQEETFYKPKRMREIWESMTNFSPLKTELSLRNQQLWMVQTFEDGTQRSFYNNANNYELMEDLGEPKKIADKSFVKSHQDEDKAILQRNEYIGDLNGTHLIFQTNCELQLRNKNETIWSFAPCERPIKDCIFNIQAEGFPEISNLCSEISIIRSESSLKALRSEILITEDKLTITQTLEDGTERKFHNKPSEEFGLLRKGPTQIAHNNISGSFHDPEKVLLSLNKLEYIGNLSGLHMIFQENCSLILANGSQTIWERRWIGSGSNSYAECSLQFGRPQPRHWQNSMFYGGWNTRNLAQVTAVQLVLENNMVIITVEQKDKAPEVYHSNQNTGPVVWYFLSEHSVVVKVNDKEDHTFTELSYIGNLNGVHLMTSWRCNLILKNNTQIIWEAGVLEGFCETMLKRDGSIMITSTDVMTKEKRVWSTRDLTVDHHKQISTTELSVDNDGLWLVNSYTDGTVNKFKAQEGTNSFALAQVEKNEPSKISTIDL